MSASEQTPRPKLPFVAALVLLTIRGLLLWVVVPIGVLGWLPVWAMSRGRISLGNLLGWLDLNLIAAIERTVLRPFVRAPMAWTPARDLPNVRHRIRVVDPA